MIQRNNKIALLDNSPFSKLVRVIGARWIHRFNYKFKDILKVVVYHNRKIQKKKKELLFALLASTKQNIFNWKKGHFTKMLYRGCILFKTDDLDPYATRIIRPIHEDALEGMPKLKKKLKNLK